MSEVKEQVRSFVGNHIGDHLVGDEVELFSSGLANSLFAVQIVLWIERTFDVPITSDDLDITRFRSIEAITSFVEGKQRTAVS